jgi:hypothetical protein
VFADSLFVDRNKLVAMNDRDKTHTPTVLCQTHMYILITNAELRHSTFYDGAQVKISAAKFAIHRTNNYFTHLLGRAGENEISRERKSRSLRELHVNSVHVPSEKSESRTGSGREVLTCCRRRGARSHRGCGAIENNERALHALIHAEQTESLFTERGKEG